MSEPDPKAPKPLYKPEFADKFYALYGRCINEWAFVEQRYFDVFTFALGTTRRNAAMVFYEWKDFNTQSKVTDSLMKTIVAKKAYRNYRNQWSSIAKTVERIRPFRN